MKQNIEFDYLNSEQKIIMYGLIMIKTMFQ